MPNGIPNGINHKYCGAKLPRRIYHILVQKAQTEDTKAHDKHTTANEMNVRHELGQVTHGKESNHSDGTTRSYNDTRVGGVHTEMRLGDRYTKCFKCADASLCRYVQQHASKDAAIVYSQAKERYLIGSIFNSHSFRGLFLCACWSRDSDPITEIHEHQHDRHCNHKVHEIRRCCVHVETKQAAMKKEQIGTHKS